MDFVGCEISVVQDAFEFGEGVGITGGSVEKHCHAEAGGDDRGDAIRVENEFERGEGPPGLSAARYLRRTPVHSAASKRCRKLVREMRT